MLHHRVWQLFKGQMKDLDSGLRISFLSASMLIIYVHMRERQRERRPALEWGSTKKGQTTKEDVRKGDKERW